MNNYNNENEFKKWLIKNYDHNELADMYNYGANTGFHGLISTQEMFWIFSDFKDEIYTLLESKDYPILKEKPSISDMVYMGVEILAGELTNGEYLDEDQAITA